MAYLRGEQYIWTDSENWLHIWVANGYDGWDESGWATSGCEKCSQTHGECDEKCPRAEGYEHASGVAIPNDIMDAYVMMRLAELVCYGDVTKAIDHAVDLSGNFGSVVLTSNAETLKTTLSKLRLIVPRPEEVSFGDSAIPIEGGPFIPKAKLVRQILDKLRQHGIKKGDDEKDR